MVVELYQWEWKKLTDASATRGCGTSERILFSPNDYKKWGQLQVARPFFFPLFSFFIRFETIRNRLFDLTVRMHTYWCKPESLIFIFLAFILNNFDGDLSMRRSLLNVLMSRLFGLFGFVVVISGCFSHTINLWLLTEFC